MHHDEVLIPAVLQAPGYARDLIGQTAGVDLEHRVAERLVRGQALRWDDAPLVRAVLGEAALHRLPVDQDVAREQLERLVEAGGWPAVEIRALPFESGLHPLMAIGCALLRLDEPAIVRVHPEGPATSTYLHEPDEVKRYEVLLDRLWTLAADATGSATVLRKVRTTASRRPMAGLSSACGTPTTGRPGLSWRRSRGGRRSSQRSRTVGL